MFVFGTLSLQTIFFFQPQKQVCGSPSKAVWHAIRKSHFIPKDGVPMFNSDLTLRQPKQAAPERNGFPDDWVVVLGKRSGSRSLLQSDEIEAAMRDVYSSERVEIFDGDIGILEGKN